MTLTAQLRRYGLALTLAVAALLGLPPAAHAATETVLIVRGDAGWTSTGIVLDAGQTVTIQSQGSVRTAPFAVSHSGPGGQQYRCGQFDANPCALFGAPYGALIGRIDGGPAFLIGTDTVITAPTGGELELAVNDNLFTGPNDDPCCYTDNGGQFVVLVR